MYMFAAAGGVAAHSQTGFVRWARGKGAKDCTPEINTSEILVDFQWHFPMSCQWHSPTFLSLVSCIIQRT